MSDELPKDEQTVLFHWTVQALAESMLITEEQAVDLLDNANQAGRVAIRGNDYFAGVEIDGKWVFVQGRRRLTEATHEWQTLRFLERQFED
jgi:hypothetical protein